VAYDVPVQVPRQVAFNVDVPVAVPVDIPYAVERVNTVRTEVPFTVSRNRPVPVEVVIDVPVAYTKTEFIDSTEFVTGSGIQTAGLGLQRNSAGVVINDTN
jgi:hypothetical protein